MSVPWLVQRLQGLRVLLALILQQHNILLSLSLSFQDVFLLTLFQCDICHVSNHFSGHCNSAGYDQFGKHVYNSMVNCNHRALGSQFVIVLPSTVRVLHVLNIFMFALNRSSWLSSTSLVYPSCKIRYCPQDTVAVSTL